MIFRSPLTIITLLLSANIFAALNIVVSIKPIHSIVSNLTQGITEPKLLLKTNQSAHHTHLKPSQLSLLNHADLAIFIHPTFEGRLKKVLANLDANKKLIIGNVKNIHLIRNEEHNEERKEHEHDEHQEKVNYHLWLDVNNMQIFAKKLIERLIKIDPDNQSNYTTNLDKLNKNLDKLKQDINQKLSVYKPKVLASYSNTFDYFTNANHLNKSINIMSYHGERLSIFKMLESKKIMRNTQTKCLLTTIEVPKKRTNSLIKGLNINSANIDIIGFNIQQGSSHYFKLMHNITNKIVQCLR
ncbi:zinc ABC transporter substrate-binding protein [Abyssogena phaseoliformis symbiont OG214]|uniref:metal ABC transporter solute-binding protein, Zn/Mn family n=1 Tax=Abyssogena phaseoliformis symbiont TaxID=596095 RepID=UPI00191659AE|nr:zinc ABC transporter substrate-binding protein [Abyssogena phaseoliformis symbiont]MBW5289427.1 Zinc ABC transporter, periplasmic-binding protein ZnuA [Candidatus Ruthia sp. Apha_13_S6]BBB22332.1 zinc ABC transporter substrate-binding protein [Abyssogena phaseoliformis symbiont OG214]